MWHTWQTKVKGKTKISWKRNQVFLFRVKNNFVRISKDIHCKYETQQFKRWEPMYIKGYTKSTWILLVVQAKKSIWRMPWHWEPKKDVTSCEKLRGAANKHWSADIRMRKLPWWRIMGAALMYGVLCDPAKYEDSYLFSEFLESSSMMVVFTSSS